MRAPNPPSQLFVEKRKQLITSLQTDSLVVLFSPDEFLRNGDQYFKFRQNSDLYQLCGLNQEETILMLFIPEKGEVEEWIFVKQISEKQRIWNGEKFTMQQASQISGISNVLWVSEFEKLFYEKIAQVSTVYTLHDLGTKSIDPIKGINLRKREQFQHMFSEKTFHDLNPMMEKIRLIKNTIELDYLRTAVDITGVAFNRLLKKVKSFQYEHQIEAYLTYQFLMEGADGHAYEPIVASGKNACILHYVNNNQILNDGELVLLDFGAEYGLYAADCSRTIPISGQFSPRQAQVYDAVLNVFNKAKTLYIPGNTIDLINTKVGEWMEEEMINLQLFTPEQAQNHSGEEPLYKKYFMHGTAHFIGLDVHDSGSKSTPFEEGMVLSCEPALYIEAENLGIRIETDMLVANPPIDLMQHFPLTIEQIEAGF
jgi:Xaa-Pro aminopeptidase